jgi:hypothetical protein
MAAVPGVMARSTASGSTRETNGIDVGEDRRQSAPDQGVDGGGKRERRRHHLARKPKRSAQKDQRACAVVDQGQVLNA